VDTTLFAAITVVGLDRNNANEKASLGTSLPQF
jgi:hypothetical protein